MEELEYVLGTDREEIERLGFQHEVWHDAAVALWRRAGIGPGATVLDLGCGPGFTSLALADLVGRAGRVIARDQSARFLEHLRGECARRGLAGVRPSLGPVEELQLPAGSVDAAYARWLLSWLPDPGHALARVAAAVKPGGVIALQEYFDWGAMAFMPGQPILRRAVEACLQSWEQSGMTIDIGRRLPALTRECGLRVESMHPLSAIARAGSPQWRWLGAFFASYLPRLVDRGLLAAAELAEHRAEWHRRTGDANTLCYTPTMVDVVLRRP